MPDYTATALAKEGLFPQALLPDLISQVTGKSAIASLCGATPIPFNGTKEFLFNMDKDIAIVAESGKKPASTMTLSPKTIIPFKTVYQSRVTDEFMHCSEELGISILQAFTEGYAKKLARGIDFIGFHGVDPYTGTKSTIVNSCFDDDITNEVIMGAVGDTPDINIEDAIALIQAEYRDVTGIAMSAEFRRQLADMTLQSGARVYPGLAWGAEQNTMNGLSVQVNSTVSAFPVTKAESGTNYVYTDHAIVGDFAGGFRWGYALNPTFEIIQYGDPDGSGYDLKAYNQVMLRSEMYIGLSIIDPASFAIVKAKAAAT